MCPPIQKKRASRASPPSLSLRLSRRPERPPPTPTSFPPTPASPDLPEHIRFDIRASFRGAPWEGSIAALSHPASPALPGSAILLPDLPRSAPSARLPLTTLRIRDVAARLPQYAPPGSQYRASACARRFRKTRRASG